MIANRCRGRVAQFVERPSKGPASSSKSTDVGSIPGRSKGVGTIVDDNGKT